MLTFYILYPYWHTSRLICYIQEDKNSASVIYWTIELLLQAAEAELASPSETWNNTQWNDPAVNRANATYVRGTVGSVSGKGDHRLAAPQNSNDSLGGWEDGEFEPIEENVDGKWRVMVWNEQWRILGTEII